MERLGLPSPLVAAAKLEPEYMNTSEHLREPEYTQSVHCAQRPSVFMLISCQSQEGRGWPLSVGHFSPSFRQVSLKYSRWTPAHGWL